VRACYFDCFSGASGDMLLGSLLDAGLPLADLEADLAPLALPGYRLEARRVTRHGLTGTHLRVLVETMDRPAHNLDAIRDILGSCALPDRVRARSLAVFQRLARVEAAVHGVPVDHIHFHEIGAVDSLVDIVGFVSALERLGIEAVYCSPLPLGGGAVETEHGRLPVPAPATLALMAEAGAPTVPGPGPGELVTPTGAALLAEFASFQATSMAIHTVGYGFGSKELAWPNALRVWLGEQAQETAGPDADRVVQLACNLDDASGQTMGYVMDRLFAAGALDVWFTPIHMKKNRPAIQVSVLARPGDEGALAAILLRETPTLGVRYDTLRRRIAHRHLHTVDTAWGPVQVKAKVLDGQVVSFAPEYDDCARLATAANVPLAEVMEAARATASRVHGRTGAIHVE